MYADPHACPDCRAPIAAGDITCPACGLPLTGPAAVELFQTLRRADALVAQLRSHRTTRHPVPVGADADAPPEPIAASRHPGYPAQPPRGEPLDEDERLWPKRWSVPTVLLSLGGLCLAVGAIVFLAVTWSLLGVGGRTAILVVATAAAAAGTWLVAERDLRGAAETLAALASVLLALDLAGGLAAGWFGDPGLEVTLLVGGLLVGATAIAGNALLGSRGSTLLTLQGVAAIATYVAGGALISLADGSPYAWATVVVAVAGLALVAFRTAQPYLGWAEVLLAGLAWIGLTAVGLGAAYDHLRWDSGYDVRGLVLAGLLAAAVVPATRFGVAVPRSARVAAGTVAIWLWVLAASLPLLDGATAVAVVGTAVAVATATGALVLWRPTPLGRDVLRATSVSAAVGAGLLTVVHAAYLLFSILVAVLDRGPLLARYELVDLPLASWAPLLGAVAVSAAWAAVVGGRPPVPGLVAVGLAAVAMTAAAVLPYLLLPAVGTLVAASAGVGLALRLSPGPARDLTWIPAVALVPAALLLATYHPWPLLLALTALGGVAVVVVLLGTDREPLAAAAVSTMLVTGAAARLGTMLELPDPWVAAGCVVVALVVPVALVVLGRIPDPVRVYAVGGAAPVWVLSLGVVTTGDPGHGLLASGASALVGLVALRWARPGEAMVAGGLTPPLVAATAGCLAALFSAPDPWLLAAAMVAALAVVLVVALSGWALQVRHTEPGLFVLYAALAVTCTVLTVLGTSAAEATGRALTWLAVYLTLSAAGAAVVAIAERSRPVAALASALSLTALWVRLADSEVDVPEAYTLPVALVVLAFGAWVFWRDPASRSLPALGPGLALVLAPSLVIVLDEPVTLRALLVGLGALALVTLGAVRRWQAPLLAGAGVGAVLVVVELFPYQSAVPRFVLFSAIGLCLLAAGIRWEQLAVLGRRTWGRLIDLR